MSTLVRTPIDLVPEHGLDPAGYDPGTGARIPWDAPVADHADLFDLDAEALAADDAREPEPLTVIEYLTDAAGGAGMSLPEYLQL
ncbi:hypothetical protein [Amycolatopsis saalfeldensis]|uniref:Uncharacterized protein n=1 Tax=Amycolatopsis saalfeldensis TaxID=394193 RepID=A0A1H8Y3C3_9PSEU|nr:hypothetical protein [Amycolatopsis saalfeldensis]SEP46567.1 hypothetical protein SAMN04489732_110286 [Amycolatopsis saalfeldensis]